MRKRQQSHLTVAKLLAVLGVAWLCLAVVSGATLAQSEPPKSENPPPPADKKDASAPPAQADTKAQPQAGSTPALAGPPAPNATGDESPGTDESSPSARATAPRATRLRSAAARRVRSAAATQPSDQEADEPADNRADQAGKRENRPRTARDQGPTFELDENAKWVCEKTTVDLEPVWQGEKNLTFRFDIMNTGTAPLKIKGKGG